MTLSGSDSSDEDFFRSMKVYEMYENIVGVVGRYTDDVAVFSLEGRAGEDDSLSTGLDLADRLLSEIGQPVPSVGITEGNALCHLVDVGGWVVL